MPGDIQTIRGSMVGENRRSPASTETPDSTMSVTRDVTQLVKGFKDLRRFHNYEDVETKSPQRTLYNVVFLNLHLEAICGGKII